MIFQMTDIKRMNPMGSNTLRNRTVYYSPARSIGLILFWAVLIISFAVQTAIAQKIPRAPLIVIKSEAVINGDRIYLKDILDSSSDPKLAGKIEDLFIGHAPKPGKERKITGSWIISRLDSKKWLPKDAKVSAPKYIRISRKYQKLNHQLLERVFLNYITSRLGESNFKISQFKVRGAVKYPEGRMTFSILKPIPKKLSGQVSLRMAVVMEGKARGRITLSAWIDRFEAVLCAARYLHRGTILTSADLKMQQMNVSKSPANLVMDMQAAIGKQLKRNIKPGEIIRHNMISVPPLIRKGDKVKLIAQNGSLRIVTLGIAKSSGGAGDQIRIENITSKKIVVGRVKTYSTVEVIF